MDGVLKAGPPWELEPVKEWGLCRQPWSYGSSAACLLTDGEPVGMVASLFYA